VVDGGHQLEVGGQILVFLLFLALKVEVVEVEVKGLLGENCGDNHESSVW